MKPHHILVFVLLLNLLTHAGFAQYIYELDKTTRFDRMGAEEGLSTGYAQCIHQDKYGFIWIGTQLGLNLYDGYEVNVFNADPKNPRALINDWIYKILEEPDGTMWFCTQLGISKYNRANQTFTNYIPEVFDNYSDLPSSGNALMMIQDGHYFWIRNEQDLLRFDKKTETFLSFGKDTVNPEKGVFGSNLTGGFMDRAGVFWVCSGEFRDDYALSRFDKETETFVHFRNDPSDPESFVGKPVRSMMEDREGTIWVATLGGGLIEITDKEQGKFKQYAHDENDPNSLLNDDLLGVYEDSAGRIWTFGVNGFSRYNKKTAQFTNIEIPHRTYDSTESNWIRGITEGKSGELWLSSVEGVFRFDPATRVLTHYLFDRANENSLSHNVIIQ
ncbi:MAG: two-component regulator propeller domain-containing protein, partial [bacterium]